ncbi:MAG TPA: ribonuclease HII, partial [Flavobacteriales bacterium]|nr:ribonuclease HII [Flavobacteriales bacterium]
AIEALTLPPELLLIDGNRFTPYFGIAHHCVIQGDGKYRSIAAASVLAKTHRDELMRSMHTARPEFNWAVNKGYPTVEHRAAIALHGPSGHHRKSFSLLPAPAGA